MRFRRYRATAPHCRIQDTGVTFRDSLRQGILLPLVQQIEIQLFFDFLLAFNSQYILLLWRNGRNTSGGLCLLHLYVLDVNLQPFNQIIYRTDNGLLHCTKRIVQIHYHRVFIAAVCDKIVTLQQHLVISRDLLLHLHIGNRIGRYQFKRLLRIWQVIADVFSNSYLVFQTQTFLFVLAGILQVHAGFRFDVGQLVFPFERFDISIDTSQFLFDDNQPVGDKFRRTDRYSVLIFNRILVVNGNQCIQDILRTCNRNIRQAQINDGRHLIRQCTLQSRLIPFSDRFQSRFRYLNRYIIVIVRVIEAWYHYNTPHRSLYGIIQSYVLSFLDFNPLTITVSRNEIRKPYLLLGERCHL